MVRDFVKFKQRRESQVKEKAFFPCAGILEDSMVRAKMVLESVIPYAYSGAQAIFRCSYDQSVEDKGFCKATPSGEARFQIDNPEAMKKLVIGKAYYFDISPAD